MLSLLDRLNQSSARLVELVQQTPGDRLRRKPGSQWATLEVLGHLRDRERVFGERIDLFVAGVQVIPNWDETSAAADERYFRETPAAILAEYQELRQRNLERLAELQAEVWDREARHEVQGTYAFRTEVERVAAHDQEHLQQLSEMLTA